jgi:hypothetical protein
MRVIVMGIATAVGLGIAAGPFVLSAQPGQAPAAPALAASTPSATAAAAGPTSIPPEPTAPRAFNYDGEIKPVLARYCTGCHGGARPRADMRLTFANEDEAREKLKEDDEFWERVANNIESKQMPPAGRRAPSDAERELLVEWIYTRVMTTDGKPDPGPFMVRRLNNREYANTVRDLLYLPDHYNAAADFPADERGDGFDNNAGTLTISPLLIENYLAASEAAVSRALGMKPKSAAGIAAAAAAAPLPVQEAAGPRNDQTLANTRSKLNEPSAGFREDFADRQAKVRLNVELLAPRAYRRPVTRQEVDELMRFAALSFAHAGESFDEATALAARAAVMSPEFLFHIERDPNPDGTGKVFEITEYQLASRLSYFLWSTMPDEELFKAAKEGTLRKNLDAHVRRMLEHPKAASLTKDFLGQWLEIRGLHETTNADPALIAAMQGETEHFFNYIVRNDRSIIEFLDADYTFVNGRLAELYGMAGITGDEFQKVPVDRTRRGGIFTQASFLTLTSKPVGNTRRTSPVLRGKWILENIFNTKIPPPPPNVPSLDFDPNKELKGTVRQIFEQHRVDPTCAGCHARMDPYGFALENYDGYGAWRDQDNKLDVDASGEINGKPFNGPVEFRAMLAARHDDFRRAVVRKLLSYALGRGLQAYDRSSVEAIASTIKADGDRFSSLILNIVKSYPFQHARGMKGETATLEVDGSTPRHHPVLVPLPPQPPPPARGRGQGQGRGAGPGRGQGPGQGPAPGAQPGQPQGQAPGQAPAAALPGAPGQPPASTQPLETTPAPGAAVPGVAPAPRTDGAGSAPAAPGTAPAGQTASETRR